MRRSSRSETSSACWRPQRLIRRKVRSNSAKPRSTSDSWLTLSQNGSVAEIQAASSKSRDTAGAHPSTKRRAPEPAEDEDESDDGFEQMDVDQKDADDAAAYAQETEDEERATPQPLEDEEGNTTTDDELEAPAPSQRPAPAQTKVNPSERPTPSKEATPPPRRELPFSRRGPAAATAPSKPEHQPVSYEDQLWQKLGLNGPRGLLADSANVVSLVEYKHSAAGLARPAAPVRSF